MSALALACPTPVAWAERVSADIAALLSDHAHCELQAEASAKALIARIPGQVRVARALTAVAREEREHFARVVRVLEARGETLRPHARSPYAERLLAGARRGRRDARLDRLIVSALIEARSHERFELLARHLADRELAGLYRSLLASEAAHRLLFLDLAHEVAPAERVEERVAELAELEGRIVAELPFAFRMHSGMRESER